MTAWVPFVNSTLGPLVMVAAWLVNAAQASAATHPVTKIDLIPKKTLPLQVRFYQEGLAGSLGCPGQISGQIAPVHNPGIGQHLLHIVIARETPFPIPAHEKY